jgi:hypothetical protein
VIREVNSDMQPTETWHKRVVFDVESKRVASAWAPLSGAVKYFLVSTNAVANCVVPVIYVVDNGDQGKAIGLKVALTVRCREGNEESVVEALGVDANPTAVFVNKIREWSREYLGWQTTAFFESFSSTKLQLSSHVADRALSEIGLDLVVEVSLYGDESAVGSTSLGPWDLQVEPRDYQGLFNVRMAAQLTPDNLVDAVAYRGERVSLSDLVRQCTHRYFSESVSVAQLFRELDNVAAGLKLYLNDCLKPVGQRVQTLRLETAETIRPQDSEVQQRVEYKGLGHPEPIFITDVAKLTVQDYGTYAGSNTPDLDQWLAQTLDEVTQETLNEKTYQNILVELSPITRDIRNKISFKAAAIGCGIQQQLTITSPTLEQWSKDFEIVTEETFATRYERFQIGLRITVIAVLRRPDEAIAYLARGLDLSELFKRKISDEARRVLLNVHPIRLCERITASAPSGEDSVRVVLDRGIRERLLHDFNAEPISILIETLDSGFTKSLNNFWNENIIFDAELFSQSPRQSGSTVYSFDCQIEEITNRGWEIAAAAGFDFLKFKTQLVNTLKSELENHDSADAGVANSETAVRIKTEITELVAAYALREFGVGLRVRSVRRKMTEAEKKLREAAVANELARIELVRKLEYDLLQLIAVGGRAEEIVAGRRCIAELKAYNTTPHNNHIANGNNAGVTQVEAFEVPK